jgi:hypothetical protein
MNLQKIISYSLFGNNDRYTQGAIINANLAAKHMPDWEVHIWHDDSVPVKVLEELFMMDNVTLKFINSDAPMTTARFRSVDKNSIVIFRDVDDRISIRGIQAVNEWIDSELPYHIIKDHPEGHSAPMLAGLWGARDCNIDMNSLIENYFNIDRELNRNSDQEFLSEIIYPMIKNKTLFHSEHYTIKIEGDSKMVSFSTPNRYPNNYLGVALLANDYFAHELDNKQNGGKPYVYDFE